MNTRRTFLQTAGAGLMVRWSAPAASIAANSTANDAVNVSVIGLGGRGRDHLHEFLKRPDVRIAALCDVDQAALERAQSEVEKATGVRPKGYADMRGVFDDAGVDAVSMATPNHWHALGTIWAVQAGKDVYVEKPASHNVFEGRKMAESARKYGRIVQVGLQSRSTPHKQKAVELLRQSAIGKVYLAKGICYKRRRSIGHRADSATPPGVDWDRFLGPAPLRPFNELRFKYNWHWFWDTGNGDIGNNGVHQMDVARWGLGVCAPRRISSTGGKYVYDDDQETPNTQIATFDYGDKELILEVRGLPTGGEAGMISPWGNLSATVFYGSDGYMTLDDDGYRIYRGEKLESTGEVRGDGDATAPHIANFLDAVRQRRPELLRAGIDEGAMSTDLCHFANISYRTGRLLNLDVAAGRFRGDPEANALLTREYRSPYVVQGRV
jgi:predicted dehydrogenase